MIKSEDVSSTYLSKIFDLVFGYEVKDNFQPYKNFLNIFGLISHFARILKASDWPAVK
ncbi:hypothetical protein M408DRAFT_233803 [Serendipita vermifera MAFF 305830]|uniref:Uncharacterized protein n=1 Tax=Serendipita vermifera MAFF 305830 TaxID=933852 RepID=A0A0C2X547_SERVB|nr:hypothetical protein M408DRAFT_233803 [Serendipita vermifera MAFF 305830]